MGRKPLPETMASHDEPKRRLSRPEIASHMHAILQWRFPERVGRYSLHGYSRAADSTGFMVPELGWALDAGVIAHNQRPEHVFISHTHSDHIHMLTHLKSRHKPPVFYVPAHAVELVERYLTVAQELTHSRPEDTPETWQTAYHLRGLEPGDAIRLSKGRHLVRTIPCDHTVPCLGYCFYELRRKLKPEYVGLPGTEIAALRAQGVEISAEQEHPLFAFLGDTTAAVFNTHPELLSMPLVITECSFLDEDEHAETAQNTKHTLWSELREVIQHHPNTDFVLTHFSWRYKDDEVKTFFHNQKLPNLIPWIA